MSQEIDLSFDTPEPIDLYVENGRGSVVVSATETVETTVRITGDRAEEFDVRDLGGHGDERRIAILAPRRGGGFLGKDPRVDILGHCTGRKLKGLPDPGPEDIPDSAYVRKRSAFDAELVFSACEATDTAFDITCRPERRDPPDDLLTLAVDMGCWISIDTDAHAPAQLEWQPYGCDKAVRHGLGPDRVVNTWAADDLLAWTEA